MGLMYLMLPVPDPRMTKTDIKVGWATDRARQRRRARTHRRESPGMHTVALWPASREYEERWHARNMEDSMPRRREWYFPTLRLVQAIRHELRAAAESSAVVWVGGYSEIAVMHRLEELLKAADEIEHLMWQFRESAER